MGAVRTAPGLASFGGVVVVNGLGHHGACCIQTGNLCQRSLGTLLVNQGCQLLRLRVFFAAEMHCRRDPFDQVNMRQSIFQRTKQRLNQTIARAQFTQRLTTYALNVIFQVRILETAEDFLDVGGVLLCIKALAFDQYRAALFHRPFHHGANVLIENRVADRLVPGQFSEVGGYSMSGV